MIAIKRNFYNRQDNPMRLDTYTDVRKGTYSAFRLGEVCYHIELPFETLIG